MAVITQVKIFKDERRQLYRRDVMTERQTLIIPSDGSGAYFKQSVLAKTNTSLPLVSQPTQIKYGTRTCRSHSDIAELRRGRVLIPDLPYNWSLYKRNSGQYQFRQGLTANGSTAYDWVAFRREFDAEYWASSTHASGYVTSTDRLNQKLLEKAKGEVWNAPVFFLEAKKTTDMVVSRAADMVRLVRLLKSGRIDKFLSGLRTSLSTTERSALKRAYNRDYGRGDTSKAAANAWLETTYGWTPFMMDVYQGMETLAAVQSDERNRVGTVRASVKDSNMLLTTTPASSPLSPGTFRDWANYQESRRGTWKFEPRLEAYMLGKLGLTNPLLVAWELLPFSFVADWFIPIGDYLEVLDVPMLMQHRGGSHTLRRETYHTKTYHPLTSGGGSGSSQVIGFARYPFTGIPHVSMNLLTFNPKLGAKRVASAAALLRQVLSFR